jgi:hypothetical protein
MRAQIDDLKVQRDQWRMQAELLATSLPKSFRWPWRLRREQAQKLLPAPG